MNMFKSFGYEFDPDRAKDPTLQDYKLIATYQQLEKHILEILASDRLTDSAKKEDVKKAIEDSFKFIQGLEDESDKKHELAVSGAYKTALVEPQLSDTEKLRRAMVAQEIRTYIRETYGNDFTSAIAKEAEFLKSPDFIRAFADSPIPSVQKQFMATLENQRDSDGNPLTVQDLMILARNPQAAITIKEAKNLQNASDAIYKYTKQEIEKLSSISVERAKQLAKSAATAAERDGIAAKIAESMKDGNGVTEL